jgi:aldose 1-epimerase
VTDLRLQNSYLSLTISPSNGGGIVSFEAFGESVLKPAPDPISGPTDPAAFVLLPYCNRIAHGHARFGNQSFRLTRPLAGEPHALHGEGWRSAWEVKNHDEEIVELRFVHKPTKGTWPWAFEATQRYELTDVGMVHTLQIRNTSDQPMPAGLGFHPYFPRSAGDKFSAQVGGKWNVTDDLLPKDHDLGSPEDFWPQSQLPVDVPLDHCFTGWDGKLVVTRKNTRINLTASDELGLLHVYAPRGADFFCAEPVSHMPNALNRPGEPNQMHALQPGEAFKASVSYLIEKPVR